MAIPKRQFDLSKIKSSKTRQIINEAASVAEQLDRNGSVRMANAVDRLIRSRISSNVTNAQLAADLRSALGNVDNPPPQKEDQS